MTQRKGRNENQNFLPVSWNKNCTKCQNEKDMIEALDVKDMLPPKTEIQLKGIHK